MVAALVSARQGARETRRAGDNDQRRSGSDAATVASACTIHSIWAPAAALPAASTSAAEQLGVRTEHSRQACAGETFRRRTAISVPLSFASSAIWSRSK